MIQIVTPERRDQIASEMRRRIMNVLPAASYQMDRFLQLVDVVVSERSETAGVETGPQPRLHLNADFVQRHCRRDEHLLLLILHELYHIILGHTRLFPRLTEAHNLAFDAVINAMLCHQFRDPLYLRFFQRLNPWWQFPSRLLRPPPGWPARSRRLPPDASEAERRVVGLLYGRRPEAVTYGEILNLLKAELGHKGEGRFTLLGEHAPDGKMPQGDSRAVDDNLFRGIMSRVTEGWPYEAHFGTGQGVDQDVLDFLLPKPKSPRAEFLQALRRLLDRAGVLLSHMGTPYAWKTLPYQEDRSTFLPNWRDRQAHSKEVLWGSAPLMYRTESTSRRPRWSPRNVTHVYFDISGSMDESLPWLTAAFDVLNRRGVCRLYAFSTVVDEIRRGCLTTARIRNTYGTDINCVYRHVLGLRAGTSPRRVVVVTDGYTGTPESELEKEWNDRRIKLYVGLVEGSGTQLAPHAEVIETLPSLC